MLHFDENYIEIKTKSKMYVITTISIICVIIIFVGLTIFSFKSIFTEFEKHKYYIAEVNDNNKEEIISLLNNENIEYCGSIYKIEYERNFIGAIFSTIYCKSEDSISFCFRKHNDSKIIQYINEWYY